MKNVLFSVVLLGVAGCTSSDEATRALSGAGYKDIQITGYRLWGCDENDEFHTGFSATGPTGARASGVVCSAIFKSATIRFD